MIKNLEGLLDNALFEDDRRSRNIALTIIESALASADPKSLVKTNIQLNGYSLNIGSKTIDLKKYDRIFVIGAGKASGAMAEAIEEILGDKIIDGSLNVPRDSSHVFETKSIRIYEAGHPIPDKRGLKGAENIMMIIDDAKEHDLILSLISGGGSALLPLPAGDIMLKEIQEVTDSLLRCGANIEEINMVRKHMSSIKGGLLAKHAYPATLISLLISDVVGDPLPSIASGPTVPDPSTFSDAFHVLRRYGIWNEISDSIRTHMSKGLEGKIPESPKPSDPYFRKVYNMIIGSNRIALNAASVKARQLGLTPIILTSFIEGEARHVGTVMASIARESTVQTGSLQRPNVFLTGGETTVTVTGGGKGGRNQEVALSASLRIKGLKGVTIVSVGTDGIDGPTEAAGAIVDGSTVKRANEIGMNPIEYLDDNNSYHFFDKLGDLIMTGPTGTNVNDIIMIVTL